LVIVYGAKEEVSIDSSLHKEIYSKLKEKVEKKFKYKIGDIAKEYDLPNWFVSNLKKNGESYAYRYSPSLSNSRSVEDFELDGLKFSLLDNDSTKGTTEIYINAEPYVLLKVVYSNEEAKLWISNNISRIKKRLMSVGTLETITREEWDKMHKTVKNQKEDKKDSIPSFEGLEKIHNELILKESRCLGYC
jgi:hypothetical protein